jgi:callose synthase
MKGYKSINMRESSLLAQCQALADMKFTYVVSCQKYGIQKRSEDPRAQDVLKLLTMYAVNLDFVNSSDTK